MRTTCRPRHVERQLLQQLAKSLLIPIPLSAAFLFLVAPFALSPSELVDLSRVLLVTGLMMEFMMCLIILTVRASYMHDRVKRFQQLQRSRRIREWSDVLTEAVDW